jgi:hypothetical protein
MPTYLLMMIFSTITFSKPGLEDPSRPETDDAITGFNCARWVMSWLKGFESTRFDEEPIAEDWGYAVRVRIGADTLYLGCSSAFEDDVNRWRVVVGDSFTRGVFPWTRQRRRNEAERLSAFVEQRLRSTEGVTNIEIERLG